jgi:hypothetical protein
MGSGGNIPQPEMANKTDAAVVDKNVFFID